GRFKNWYLEKVQWALSHRLSIVAASTVLMAGTFWLATRLPTEFIPAGDYGFVNINTSLPPGSTMEDARTVARDIYKRLESYQEVKHATVSLSPRSANAFITLVDREERERSQSELQQAIIGEL